MYTYWKNHPYQLRLVALILLLTLPISLTTLLLIANYEEILSEVKSSTMQLWRIFAGKEKP